MEQYISKEFPDGASVEAALLRAKAGGAIDLALSTKPGEWLNDNGVFLPGCLVDQRDGRVVKPNTTYYSDNQLTTSAGTTSAYVTAHRYATGTASGVNYASFKLTDTDAAPTYYAAPANVVRGYTGVGYGLDRWRISNLTLLVQSDGILLVNTTDTIGTFEQYIESPAELSDTKLCFSAYGYRVSGEKYCYLTDVLNTYRKDIGFTDNPSVISFTDQNSAIETARYCVVVNAGCSVKLYSTKMEFGATQTIAHQDADGNWQLNELPRYADTLARCQRYCFSPTFGAKPSYASLGVGRGNDSGDGAYIQIPTPVSMRDIPVIVNKENLYMNGAAVTDISVEAVSASAITVNVKANIQTTPTGCYSLQMSNGANLLFFAGP